MEWLLIGTRLLPNANYIGIERNGEPTDAFTGGSLRQQDSEQTESWEVALYLEQIAHAAVEYLVQLTMRLQDSML